MRSNSERGPPEQERLEGYAPAVEEKTGSLGGGMFRDLKASRVEVYRTKPEERSDELV